MEPNQPAVWMRSFRTPPITYSTDFWHPYGLSFAQQRHLQGKAHTFTIESHNHRLRV